MRTLILTASVFFLCSAAQAQSRSFRIKRAQDVQLNISGGATQFLGELGGGPDMGEKGIQDLDFEATRIMTGIGFVYRSSRHTRLRIDVNLARFHGSDAYTSNELKRARGLTFNTNLVEPTIQIEQQLTNLRTRYRKKGGNLFVVAGASVLVFDPEVHSARLDDNPEYNKFPVTSSFLPVSFAIPFGISYRHEMKSGNSLGVEFSMRKTFTDYLDGYGTESVLNLRPEDNDPNGLGNNIRVTDNLSTKAFDDFFYITFSYRTSVNPRAWFDPTVKGGTGCPIFR